MHHMPSSFVVGLCLPYICDDESVDEIALQANQLLQNKVAPFFKNLNSFDSTFGEIAFSTTALFPDVTLQEEEDKQVYPFAGLLIVLVILLVLQVTGFIQEISQRSKAPSIRPEHASVAKEQLSELQFELYIEDPFGNSTPPRFSSLQVRDTKIMQKIRTFQSGASFAQSETSSIFEVSPRIYLIKYMEQLRERRFQAISVSFNSQIYQKKRAMRNFWGKVRKSFSPSRNWNLLYQRRALGEENGQFGYPVDMSEFDVIDGLKVIATLWILIMCSLLFTTSTSFYNTWRYFNIQENVSFTVLVQGMLCFDLLIAISALFSFYKLARFQETSNSIHCCRSFSLRLFRLLPLYYFTFLFGWAGLPSLIHKGPMWDRYSKLYADCSKYWWTELFLIGNIIPWERPQLEGCFFWNWYICLDVQLFLLIPIIVKLWSYNKKATELGLVVGLLILNLLDFILLYNFTDYSVGVLSSRNTNMQSLVAERPWGRLDCFIVGILFAIILLYIREYREARVNTQILHWSKRSKDQLLTILYPTVHKLHKPSFKLTCLLNFIGFIFLCCFLGSVFLAYPPNRNPNDWPEWANSLFLAFGGTIFIISLLGIVVIIFLGRLSWVRAVLGFELMTPLAKLMYGVYLSSPLIIVAFYVSLQTSPVLETKALVVFAASFLLVALGFASVLFFLVDAPFGHQIKDLLKARWIPQYLPKK